jgi:hypothetical protein
MNLIKIAGMFGVSVFGFWICCVSTGTTGEYHFVWDSSPNESVVEFRIYYRTDSGRYNMTDFETVLLDHSKFDPTNPGWKLVLPDVAEPYCFVIKAVDANDFESAPSNEIGMGKTCGGIVDDGRGKDGQGGEGEAGRCFILQGILHDKRWDSY